MATASVILPGEVPELRELEKFGSWKIEVSTFVVMLKNINYSVAEKTIHLLAFARLINNVYVLRDSLIEITAEWKEIFSNEGDDTGNLINKFIEFIKEKLELAGLTSVLARKAREWHSSSLTRREIYKEALFLEECKVDSNTILRCLRSCDEELYKVALNKVDKHSVTAIVTIMRERDIILTQDSGIQRLDLPFKSTVQNVKKIHLKKKFKKKSFKCFNCGKHGHMAKYCKAPKDNKEKVSYIGPLFYKDLLVGGKKLKCLIDTGATCSFIRKNSMGGVKWITKSPNKQIFATANGTDLETAGEVVCNVEFEGKNYHCTFKITETLNDEVIVGADFLSFNKLMVNMYKKELVINSLVNKEDIMEKYEDIFVENLEDSASIAKVDPIKIEIEKDAVPIYQRNFKLSDEEKEIIKKETNKMLKSGVIEKVKPCDTSKGWNSPILLIKKNDGSWRFCIDFRKLNKVTLKESAQLPLIDDLIQKAGKGKVFSKLDLASGYWQLRVEENSRKLLRFETEDGQYQFKVLPFGVTNAPAIFQRVMNNILKGIDGVVVLIDDIVIFAKNRVENEKVLKDVLKRLAQYGFKVKRKKCSFFKEELKLFGYWIKEGKILPDPDKVEVIKKMNRPENLKTLLTFLGMTNYFRRLIKDYASFEARIRKCINKSDKLEWTDDGIEAYNHLIGKLCEYPYNFPYSKDLGIILHCDASGNSIGAVLSQVNDKGKEIPIYYYSRLLKEREMRYSTIEKELTAIHDSLLKLRQYLIGRKFIVKTDHKPLLGIIKNNTSSLGARWARRLLRISEYEFEIEYLRGKDNVVADALSRINSLKSKLPSLKEAQEKDKEIQRFLKNDNRSYLDNGIVTMIRKDGTQVILLPEILRYEALVEAHGVEGGHFNHIKTFRKLSENFYWKTMFNDTKQFVDTCHECQMSKKHKEKMTSTENIQKREVWSDLAMDLMGPFEGGRSIIILIDMFSKFTVGKVLKRTISKNIISFLKETFNKFGVPKSVLSDNGKQFISLGTKEFLKFKGIADKNSTPYNPQGNGIAERVIRTIKGNIRSLYVEGLDLKESLEKSLFAYNTTYHDSTRYSPFELMFGRKSNSVLRNKLIDNQGEIMRETPNITVGRKRLIAKHNLLTQEYNQNKRLIKKNKIDKNITFEEGERVVIRNEHRTNTLDPYYKGPYKIIRKINKFLYMVESFIKPINVRRLAKYYPPRNLLPKSEIEDKQIGITTGEKSLEVILIPGDVESIGINQEDRDPSTNYQENMMENGIESNTIMNRVENETTEENWVKSKKELRKAMNHFFIGNMKSSEFKDYIHMYVRKGTKELFGMFSKPNSKDLMKEWIKNSRKENYVERLS